MEETIQNAGKIMEELVKAQIVKLLGVDLNFFTLAHIECRVKLLNHLLTLKFEQADLIENLKTGQ